jgi:hypothetical protein
MIACRFAHLLFDCFLGTSLMEGLVDHFVKLERVPDGLVFPPDLADRIRIDAQAKTLSFNGYMSKADFDRLSQLTRDWSFRRKLEELFQICIDDDRPKPKGIHGLLSIFQRRTVPS